ncbi:LuxR C-terminal-related transcriptional regulator [Streptomyces sp. NPDC056323]|uniref:LuxR C-terminal-related transcriptional regulator n=1 Tax=unclassified Streptomyces TaxID=2593676 RepID=UPI0035DA44B4
MLIAEGLSDPEIARRPHISQATVRSHISNLFAGAGVRDGHRPFAMRTFGASHSRPDGPSPEEVKTGE